MNEFNKRAEAQNPTLGEKIISIKNAIQSFREGGGISVSEIISMVKGDPEILHHVREKIEKKKEESIPNPQVEEPSFEKYELNEVGEKGNRLVDFGGFTLQERSEDFLTEEELSDYQEGFSLYKRMVESSENLEDKAFLASRSVLKLLLGLEPESSYFLNEASVLNKYLTKIGEKEKFAVLEAGKYGDLVSFVNVKAARRVLDNQKDTLGLQNFEEDSSDEAVVQTVMDLFNDPDPQKRHTAIGLLSGFPKTAVEHWVKEPRHLSEFPLSTLNESISNNFDQSRTLPLEKERIEDIYSKPLLQLSSEPRIVDDEVVGVHGMGFDFQAPYPLETDVETHCQKLLDLDRKMGVVEYNNNIRSEITRESSAKQAKSESPESAADDFQAPTN